MSLINTLLLRASTSQKGPIHLKGPHTPERPPYTLKGPIHSKLNCAV